MSGQGFPRGETSLSEGRFSGIARHLDFPVLANRLLDILAHAIRLLTVTARLAPGPRTLDDAYITYCYTRNILAGNGFVYNPGQRVLGSTTPLYTLLLAAATTYLGKRYSLASVTPTLAILLVVPLALDHLPDYIMLIFARNP